MAWYDAEEINKEVLEAVKGAMRYAHLSCGIELQRVWIDQLYPLHDRLRVLRFFANSQSDEPCANAAFRAQMLVLGTAGFLEMWVLLKEDKPNEAWNKLAEAQQSLDIAQRILFDPDTRDFIRHLLNVECVVFPPQTFFSTAYTYTKAYCSICDKVYGTCDHIAARIYMGRICRRHIPECSVSEYSIVTKPKDKRCRADHYSDNGKVYCTLTRRELPQEKPVHPEDKFVGGPVIYFD